MLSNFTLFGAAISAKERRLQWTLWRTAGRLIGRVQIYVISLNKTSAVNVNSTPVTLFLNSLNNFPRTDCKKCSFYSLHDLPLTSSVCRCQHISLLSARTRFKTVSELDMLTHWGRVTQICLFNTRLFSLHNTLNYAIHRACLRMVLLTDVYRNLTSLWINL